MDSATLFPLVMDLPGNDSVVFLPEPEAKRRIAEFGVPVPRGATARDAAGVAVAAAGLTPPLVVKAWGPDLLHKSDAGAVVLGIASAEAAGRVAAAMEARLAPSGFLVEEQQPKGIEMILGVVDRPPFGRFMAVGFGGTLTEILQDVALRPLPVSEEDAAAMLVELRGRKLLDGLRGGAPVDRKALANLIVKIGGVGGLAETLGPQLAEFEINPVIVSPAGAVAVDARLLLYREAPLAEATAPAGDFGPLFAPTAVAVVGASAKGSNFGNMFLRNYRAFGYPGRLYAIHPDAAEIDGVRAYPSLADIPEPIDYALIAAPAPRTPEIVAAGASRVKFAQVMSGGFRETGEAGAALESALLASARSAGIRLLGPNCMGVWSARGRQTFLGSPPERSGNAAIVSQSGSLGGDILRVGDRLGIGFSCLATIGNSIDVNAGELVEWLADDPNTGLIGLYLEDPRDGARLIRALRKARAKGKPAVLLIAGTSPQGASAAASHTGALANDLRVWHGIAAQTGAALARSLEEFLDILLLAQIDQAKPGIGGREVLIVGAGGGCNVLATDACDDAGLAVAPVESELAARLGAEYGAGASFANPVEVPMGPLNASAIAPKLLRLLNEGAPYPNVMFHINVQSFYSYGKSAEHSTRSLVELADTLVALSAELPRSRLTWILRNAICADGDVIGRLRQTAHAGGVATFLGFQSAATAIAALAQG